MYVIFTYLKEKWETWSVKKYPPICLNNLLFLDSNREYIEKTKLRKIKYKILEFNPMVLKGKVNPDSSRPELLHPVSSAGLCCVTLNSSLFLKSDQIYVNTLFLDSCFKSWRLLYNNCFLILVSFVLQLNFVRFYLPLLGIENHERIVYLDDDVIVQGEIHYYV